MAQGRQKYHQQGAIKKAMRHSVGPDIRINTETVEKFTRLLAEQGYEIVRKQHALPVLDLPKIPGDEGD